MTSSPPYSDSTRMPVAFGVSVLLHLLLLGSLIAFVWNKAAPINLQHTLELVDGPAPSDSNSSTDSSTSAADSTALSQPSISAINYPTITTPTPEPPTPTPPALTTPTTPTPPSPPPPTPSPTNTHQAKPTPTPTPTPSQPKTMTYAEFAKEHHLSTNPTPATATPRSGTHGVPNVGINTGGIVKNLNTLANGTGHGTANGHSSTTTSANNENYADYLAKRLGDAFKPPNAISGLTADIELTIGPDGEIHQKLIIRKSGIEAFDAAVQDALNSLTNVDPPPSGQTETFRFTFTPH